MTKRLPRVALVGRINAGKSTLFNTISESTRAIVSSLPGTTRDLNYAAIDWQGTSFEIVDTGGLDAAQLGAIEVSVQAKAYEAIKQADILVLVIDGTGDLTHADRQIALTLKKSGKKTILAINKIDNNRLRRSVSPDFYKIGLGEPVLISAQTGVGTGDLMDAIVRQIPKKMRVGPAIETKLSIIGKTNVGKSSLLNAIIGEERVIVSPIPHTTREPQDITFNYKGHSLMIIDTAGLRKNSHVSNQIEKTSVAMTMNMIKNSDICLFVTDATQPLGSQDQHIANLALKYRHGIIIVVNKWDLVPDKTPETINKFIEYYQHYFSGLYWAPIIFISALEKQRVSKLIDLCLKVRTAQLRVVPQPDLDDLIKDMRRAKKVSRIEARRKKSTYRLQQVDTDPPRFDLMVSRREDIHPAFLNFLEKEMRKRFDFNGTPLSITLQRP